MRCFIYLALPEWLASQFPPRKHPPHVTLVFLGDVSESVYEASVQIFEEVLQNFEPFPVALVNYGEFTSSGSKYPHMTVVGPQLRKLQRAYTAALKSRGLKPAGSGFVPHATLAKTSRGEVYSGPKPTGTWIANAFAASGHTDYEISLEFPSREKRAIIMRGIPGSGKSTYLAENYPNALIASADHYFIKNGIYVWDKAQAHAAHRACLQYFKALVEVGAPLIAVDNTNLTTANIKPYYLLAEQAKYDVQIVTLLEDPQIAYDAGLHGVSLEKTQEMHDKLLRVRLPLAWNNLVIDYR